MRPTLLAVRFLLELAMLAALAGWGFALDANLGLRMLAGVGAPAIAIGVWGRWVAPKSDNQLDDPARLLLEGVLFGFAALALWAAGQTALALALAVAYAVDRATLSLSGGTGVAD